MEFVKLGLILFGIGLLTLGLVRLILALIPRWRMQRLLKSQTVVEDKDAVLIIEHAGKVHSINAEMRNLFHIPPGDTPPLGALVAQLSPQDKFLNLCINEGRERLRLHDGTLLEVRSNHVEMNHTRFQILNLYPLELMNELGLQSNDENTSQTSLMSVLDISKTIHQSHELEATVKNIINQFRIFIPSEFVELCVFDIADGYLSAYQYIGRPGEEPEFSHIDKKYQLDGTTPSFAAHIFETRESMMVNNIPIHRELQSYQERETYPFNSYLGVPLFSGNSLIGTISFGLLRNYGFSEPNRNMLIAFSEQMGIALFNAQEFDRQNRLAIEQAVLSQFAEILYQETPGEGLVERLVKGISGLVQVDLLGFLFYNVEWNMLIGQAPFHGLSEQIIELYEVEVLPQSQGARLIESQEILIFHEAPEDPRCRALGIDHLARAAGLRDLILFPLISGGQFLGYLQAAWNEPLPESELNADVHLLSRIVSQTAPAIENQILIERSRERANRAETLQHITATANTITNAEEFQNQALDTILELLDGEVILLLLLDKEFTQLQVSEVRTRHYAGDVSDLDLQVLIQDAQYSMTVTARMQSTYCDDVQAQLVDLAITDVPRLLPVYLDLFEEMNIRSAVAAPIAIRGSAIGEIWVLAEAPRKFRRSDLNTLEMATGQISGFMDRIRLYEETDFSLRKQVEHLTILRRITNELSTTLDFNHLMEMVHAQAMRITNVHHGTILMYDTKYFFDERPRIEMVVGDPPEDAMAVLERKALDSGTLLYVEDIANSYPEQAAALGIGSVMLCPIFYQDRPAGMLIMKAKEAFHFDELMLEVMDSLTAQTAIAMGNAIQYDRQKRRGVLLHREMTTIESLRTCFSEAMRAQLFSDKLQVAADMLQKATPFKLVAVSLYDAEQKLMRRHFTAGNLSEGGSFIQQINHGWYDLQDMLSSELMISNSYYVTENRVPVVIEAVHMLPLEEIQEDQKPLMRWRSGEVFLNILRDEAEKPIGMIQLDLPDDQYRPDQPAMDALELFGAFIEYLLRSDESLSSTQEMLQIIQNRLGEKETQIKQMGEQNQLLSKQRENLEEVLEGVNRAANIGQRMTQIVDSLAQVRGDRAVIEQLGDEILTNLEAATVIIAGNIGGEEQILYTGGELPEAGAIEPLFGQRNPLRESLLMKTDYASPTMGINNEWLSSMLLRLFEFESFVSLPVEVDVDYLISILVLYPEKNGFLTMAVDDYLRKGLMNNIGLNLRTLHQLSLTQEQVENLNVLLTFSQKLSSVGPNAVVDILVESIFDTLPLVEGCWVGLENEKTQKLDTTNARGYVHPESMLEISADIAGNSLPAQVFQSGKSQRVDELNFAQAYPMNQDELIKYQYATGGKLPLSSLVVPIQLGVTTMGVIVIDNFNEVAAFSAADEAILFSMGQQTALILENADLYQQAIRRAEQLQSLSTAVQVVSSAPLRSNEMMARALTEMKTLVEFDHAAVWMREVGGLVCQYELPNQEETASLAESSLGKQLSIQSLSSHNDSSFENMPLHYLAETDENDPYLHQGVFNAAYETHILIPLIARSELIGMLVVEDQDRDAFGGAESTLLRAYASQAAVSVHNVLMYEESLKQADRLNIESERMMTLNEFGLQIGGLTSLDTIYEIALNYASTLLDASVVSFVQVSRFNHMMLIAQKPDYELSFTEDLNDVPLMQGLHQSRAVYQIPDVQERNDLGALPEIYLDKLNTRSLLMVPLVVSSQFWGWMWVQSDKVDAFDPSAVEIAKMMANHVAVSIVTATSFFETQAMRQNLEKRVTERTQELERGLEEFEMLNNNLQTILSSMADGVLVSNEHGKIVLTNSAAASILNTEQSLLQGMSMEELSELVPTTVPIDWFTRVQTWSPNNPPDRSVGIFSQRVELTDAHMLFVQGSSVLREDHFLGAVTIIRDITAEAMAERLKSEFVTNVSHELRTPITAIKGSVDVVLGQMTGDLNQQQEMFMMMARKNCDRLQILIDDILEVSQIDAGQMDLNLEALDAAEILADVVSEYEGRMRRENRSIEVNLNLPAGLSPVIGDAQRVRQIASNLISNAIQYTEDGGSIRVGARRRGDFVEFDVSDTGIGIPAETASRVFERFYRGEDELVMASAGPGLGLWITKTLVEMHGGRIWFASSGIPGEGSTFSFTLPVQREEVQYG